MTQARSTERVLRPGGKTDITSAVTPWKTVAKVAMAVCSCLLMTSRPKARLRTRLPSFVRARIRGYILLLVTYTKLHCVLLRMYVCT
jgi:hypothetical protein